MNKTLKCIIVFLIVVFMSVSVFATEILENTVNYDDQIMLINEDEGSAIPEEWRRDVSGEGSYIPEDWRREELLDGNAINENVFEASEEYILENKTINGDMFVFAEKVNLKNVTVNGNVFIFSDTAKLEYVGVTGSVYAFVLTFEMNEVNVQGNVYSMSEKLTVSNVGNVITSDMYSYAEELNFKSFVGRNLFVAGDDIEILDGTTVGGNLTYSVGDEHETEIGTNVTINGITNPVDMSASEDEVEEETVMDVRSLISTIITNTVIAGIGLIVIVLLSDKMVKQAKQKPVGTNLLKILGKGFLVFAAMIVLMVVFICTVIGIPVALALLLVFIIFVFLSKGVTSVVIASMIAKDKELTKMQLYGLSLVVILVITALETILIGFAGFIISLFVILVGFGATFNAFFKKLNNEKSNDKTVVVTDAVVVEKNIDPSEDILNKIDEIDPLKEENEENKDVDNK